MSKFENLFTILPNGGIDLNKQELRGHTIFGGLLSDKTKSKQEKLQIMMYICRYRANCFMIAAHILSNTNKRVTQALRANVANTAFSKACIGLDACNILRKRCTTISTTISLQLSFDNRRQPTNRAVSIGYLLWTMFINAIRTTTSTVFRVFYILSFNDLLICFCVR